MADNDDTKQREETDSDESLLNDVAITAEFEYQEDWESLKGMSASDSDAEKDQAPQASKLKGRGEKSEDDQSKKRRDPAAKASSSDSEGEDSITRALDDFDSYLDGSEGGGGQANSADFVDEADSRDIPAPDLANGNRSNPGAWGYDQPQVSGVFSRYEEETSAQDEDFDLFEVDEGEEPKAKTLQELTSEHEKKLRRLNRQLDYQKQVLQVMAELLVEARVISRPELKRRLKDLRRKNS